MICRTPGCATPVPDGDSERVCCERCGWPLAEGVVAVEPDTVSCQGVQPVEIRVRVSNSRPGRLRWEILSAPGVEVLDQPSEVGLFAIRDVRVRAHPARLATREVLSITVRLWDRVGRAGYDLRMEDLEACYRDYSLIAPIQIQNYGPLEVPCQSLLFGGEVTDYAVTVRNGGGAEVTVTAEATPGYVLQALGHPRGERLTARLPGGYTLVLTVYRVRNQAAREGTLTLTAPDLPAMAVQLVPIPLHHPPLPQESHVIAVDFGTTKSAVMVFDQHRQGDQPRAVLWDGEGEQQPWVPSVVSWRGGAPGAFGWDVPFLEAGPDTIRSIKMRLGDDHPRMATTIVYFLRRILGQVEMQHGRGVFSSARLVLSLPVLDNGEEYTRQRERTKEYLERAARAQGIREIPYSFYREPECAAVDFLHHLFFKPEDVLLRTGRGVPVSSVPLHDGDWLCLLDMGGGTTDLSFGQLDRTLHGEPTFSVMHSLGFPEMAGDRVDLEMYRLCLEDWSRSGRIRGGHLPASPLALDELASLEELPLEGEPRPLRRAEALQQISLLKERMYATTPPTHQVWDAFTLKSNHGVLSPEAVARALRERLAEPMFSRVRAWMDEQELSPAAIRVLCLTGGTASIDVFERALRTQLQIPDNTVTALTPNAIRMNVVRGAARRPGLRLQGLPFSVWVAVGDDPETEMLRTSSLPGAAKSKRRSFAPEESQVVRLGAAIPNQQTRTLYAVAVTNVANTPLVLEAQVRYRPGHALEERLVWVTEPEREELPWTTIQVLPH